MTTASTVAAPPIGMPMAPLSSPEVVVSELLAALEVLVCFASAWKAAKSRAELSSELMALAGRSVCGDSAAGQKART